MARTNTTEGQALWQPGGDEEDSHFCEGDRHLRPAYNDEEEEASDCPFPRRLSLRISFGHALSCCPCGFQSARLSDDV